MSQKAHYDSNGNIILPEDESMQVDDFSWDTVDEKIDQEEVKQPTQKKAGTTLRSTQKHIVEVTKELLHEGSQQYATSVQECVDGYKKIRHFLPGTLQKAWHTLMQPVWVLHPKRAPKKQSRGVLFMKDTVRFGGTFAVIFGALFVSLNYQSFYQIAADNFKPLQQVQRTTAQVSTVDSALRDKLLKSPALATAGQSPAMSLLSFLPAVGPDKNYIVVPKLGITAPLVTPSYDSLLAEDWDRVEEDIQDALQMGVVHYPGTARPGQAGNFFVTGHSSYYPWAPGAYKTIFARLHQLEIGDEYYVYYGGDKHRYVIREKEVVKPSNVDVLDQPLDKRVGTLMTCSPVGTTLNRLVLKADEIHPETGMLMAVGEKQVQQNKIAKPDMLPI